MNEKGATWHHTAQVQHGAIASMAGAWPTEHYALCTRPAGLRPGAELVQLNIRLNDVFL